MARLIILIYIFGSVLFAVTAFVKLSWCFFSGNSDLARKIVLQFDDTFNVALNGRADMKFSSRCYVGAALGSKKYSALMYVIDTLFYVFSGEQSHCYNSYLNERFKC